MPTTYDLTALTEILDRIEGDVRAHEGFPQADVYRRQADAQRAVIALVRSLEG